MGFKRSISIILVTVLVSSILGFLPTSAKNYTVKDIQSTDNDVVQWVVNQGYMSLTLGKFLPSKYVKRNEFAAIVTKLMGSGTKLQNPKKPTFQDVTTKDQFYKQIETAKSFITSFKVKTSKLFKPNSYLTREDAMYSIVKVLGYDTDEAMGSNENMDLSIDDVIEDAGRIAPALVKHVSVGISNELMDLRTVDDKIYFDPKKNISRIDLAYLIYNAYQKKDYSIEEGVDDDYSSESTSDNSGKSDSAIINRNQDSLPAGDENKGEIEVIGKLVDVKGNPVVGARVSLMQVTSISNGEFSSTNSNHWNIPGWDSHYSVITDNDGNFSIYMSDHKQNKLHTYGLVFQVLWQYRGTEIQGDDILQNPSPIAVNLSKTNNRQVDLKSIIVKQGGAIRIRISDENGNPIEDNVNISIGKQGSSSRDGGLTGGLRGGIFLSEAYPEGKYSIEVGKDGYKYFVQNNIAVKAGQITEVSVKLALK